MFIEMTRAQKMLIPPRLIGLAPTACGDVAAGPMSAESSDSNGDSSCTRAVTDGGDDAGSTGDTDGAVPVVLASGQLGPWGIRIEDIGAVSVGHVRRWDEMLGWTTSDKTFGTPGTTTEIELLWTGHDYVGVYAEFPYKGMGLPASWYELDIYLLLIGADGTIRQHQLFERSKGYGGYSPQLVMLPGSIGLSWVRVDNQAHHSRHFARLECAQ